MNLFKKASVGGFNPVRVPTSNAADRASVAHVGRIKLAGRNRYRAISLETPLRKLGHIRILIELSLRFDDRINRRNDTDTGRRLLSGLSSWWFVW